MRSPPSPAKQMAYLYPRFYNCSVPAAFLADLPQLAQLCEGTKPPLASDKRVEQLFSIQGEKFVSFVKSERFVDGKKFLMCYWSYIFYFLNINIFATIAVFFTQPLLALEHLLHRKSHSKIADLKFLNNLTIL